MCKRAPPRTRTPCSTRPLASSCALAPLYPPDSSSSLLSLLSRLQTRTFLNIPLGLPLRLTTRRRRRIPRTRSTVSTRNTNLHLPWQICPDEGLKSPTRPRLKRNTFFVAKKTTTTKKTPSATKVVVVVLLLLFLLLLLFPKEKKKKNKGVENLDR